MTFDNSEKQAQRDRAARFRDLHAGGEALVLANAWDVASARIAAAAGAPAVATTSAGVAWSLGAPDGDELDRDRAVDLVARIAAAVDVPVSADIESGFAETAEGVGETVQAVLAAGAVGINLEDAHHGGPAPLRPVEDQAARIAAARAAADAAGVPLYVNARVDTYLRAVGDPAGRLAETLARATAYVEAGADGVFVPGVIDVATVAALAEGLDVPLNILSGPGAPSVAELAKAGAARVSVGSAIAEAAYALVRRATEELLATGTYGALEGGYSYPELNALLSQ
jgi:2-methylisocitrate lyase-like PEP mutase family enzyme